MATKKNTPKKVTSRKSTAKKIAAAAKPAGATALSATTEEMLSKSFSQKQSVNPNPLKLADVDKRIIEFNLKRSTDSKKLLAIINKINPKAALPIDKLPEDVKKSIKTLKPETKRFHGAKMHIGYFPFPSVKSPCADKFGYMSTPALRALSKLPFNSSNQTLLGSLGDMMGDPGREIAPDSNIPAGFTYFGQFVDHDITLDVSSRIDVATRNPVNTKNS